MRKISKILGLIDTINEWMGKIFCFFILSLSFLVFADVFMRYLFNNPIIWATEINQYQLVALVFLSGGYTFLHNGHVRVDILYGRWSSRTKSKVDIVTSIMVFFLSIVLIGYGTEIAWESFIEHHTTTTVTASPLWPSQLMIPLGGLLLGLQCLAKWIRDFIFIFTGKKLDSEFIKGEGGIFVREEG